jgi:hypothetical protein
MLESNKGRLPLRGPSNVTYRSPITAVDSDPVLVEDMVSLDVAVVVVLLGVLVLVTVLDGESPNAVPFFLKQAHIRS